jgi:hypothetical protein
MKNRYYEQLRRRMKQYHRHHQWQLDHGLFVPHTYPDDRILSWWDDVGFILNRRRVMIWWTHPRMQYADAITDRAWQEAGEPPLHGDSLFSPSEKQWKKVGRSRKKVVAYRSQPMPDAQKEYYAKLRSIEMRLESEGIDLVVRPSLSSATFDWCTGVSACLPIEVRNREEVGALAVLARRLLKGEATLTQTFPGYAYGRDDWLSEFDQRHQDRPANGSQ